MKQYKYLLRIVWITLLALTVMSCGASSDLPIFAQPDPGIRYDGFAWSPDGKWLASESTDATTLFLFSSTGQLVQRLHLGCELGGGTEDFSWLPNGWLSCLKDGSAVRVLKVFQLDAKGQAHLKMETTLPTTPYAIVDAFQWNPYHVWLAMIADKVAGEISPQLRFFDSNGIDLIPPISMDAALLAWSPDGTMLAVVQQSGNIVLFKVQQTTNGKLMLTNIRTFSVGVPYYENIAWSPSGHWLVCRHESYDSEDYLFLLATDGSGKQVQITSSTTEGQLDSPAWSPDGKRLIVGRVIDGALVSLDIQQILKQKGVQP